MLYRGLCHLERAVRAYVRSSSTVSGLLLILENQRILFFARDENPNSRRTSVAGRRRRDCAAVSFTLAARIWPDGRGTCIRASFLCARLS